MRLITNLALIGIFVNFFGRSISAKLLEYNGYPYYRLIPENSYAAETHIELILVYIILFISIKFVFRKLKPISLQSGSTDGSIYIVGCFIALLLVTFYKSQFDLGTRGVDQFDRGLIEQFSRMIYILIPFMIYVYYKYRFSILYKAIYAVVIAIFVYVDIVTGNRRMTMYVLLPIALGVFYSNMRFRKWILVALSINIFILLYYATAVRGVSVVSPFLLAISSLLGLIGENGILWEVKELVNTVGFQYGATMFNPLLYVPTVVSSLFGVVETNVERGAFIFNNYYNSSSNMGYDFMLIADFYLNFGVYGYMMFIMLVVIVLKAVESLIYKGDPFSVSIAFTTVYVLLAGLRSDFPFLVKNILYVYIAIYLVRYVAINLLSKHKQHCHKECKTTYRIT